MADGASCLHFLLSGPPPLRCFVGQEDMTKRESKLLSRWPEHRRRGKVAFVLLRCVVPSAPGVVLGVLVYDALSPRHVVYWGWAAFMFVVVSVVNGARGGLLWDRLETLYADQQKPQP